MRESRLNYDEALWWLKHAWRDDFPSHAKDADLAIALADVAERIEEYVQEVLEGERV